MTETENPYYINDKKKPFIETQFTGRHQNTDILLQIAQIDIDTIQSKGKDQL